MATAKTTTKITFQEPSKLKLTKNLRRSQNKKEYAIEKCLIPTHSLAISIHDCRVIPGKINEFNGAVNNSSSGIKETCKKR